MSQKSVNTLHSNSGANKMIAKNTVALFVRMCFIAALGLVSSRYMLKYLGEEDFGIYNVVGGTVNLMAFFNVVLASATNRFLMVEMGKGESCDLSRVFTTSLQIHVIIGIAIVFIGETLGLFYICNYLNVPSDKIAEVHVIYQISLFTCALCVLQVPYQGLLITYENFTRYSFVQITMMAVVFFASLAIALFQSNRLIWFSVFMAISQTLGLFLYYILGKRYAPSLKKGVDKKQVREMIGFSGWIALGAASSMGKNQGSNVVLNYFFGPVVNSAFSIGNQVNNQMSRLYENVAKSFTPQIMSSYETGDKKRMINLVCASSKYSFFLLYLVALPFFAKTNYILSLWLGDYPKYTVAFCNIIMINILLSSLSQGVNPAVQATGKIKWFQIVGSCVTLSTIPLAIISFHWGAPPYMISIAFLSSSVISVFLNYYMMRRILHFPINILLGGIYGKVLPVLMFTIPFLLLAKRIFSDNFGGLVLTFLMLDTVILCTIWLFGLKDSERCNVKYYIKKKLKSKQK